MACMYIYFLQNKGVFGNLTFIEELSCDIFPFDNDLLSMELQNAFKVSKKNNLYNLSVQTIKGSTILRFKLSSNLNYRTHCAQCKTFNLKMAKIDHK